MFFSRPAGHKYIDRGNLPAPDFELAAFTRDNNQHALDLSSIIPENAVSVEVRLTCRETTGDKQLRLSTNGVASGFNNINAWTQSTTSYLCVIGQVTPNAAREIYYIFHTGTWDFIEFVVRGWWV